MRAGRLMGNVAEAGGPVGIVCVFTGQDLPIRGHDQFFTTPLPLDVISRRRVTGYGFPRKHANPHNGR